MPKRKPDPVHYDVYSVSGYEHYIGERATFADAERLARWHAARFAWRFEIDEVRAGHTERIAYVVRDAYGRLWTDLMAEGAKLL